MSAVQLTSVALEQWGFPQSLIVPLQQIDDRTSLAGALLRACYEMVSRLTIPDYRPAPIGPLTLHSVREADMPGILYDVRNQAEDLRQLMIG